jgi:hypothetical protein
MKGNGGGMMATTAHYELPLRVDSTRSRTVKAAVWKEPKATDRLQFHLGRSFKNAPTSAKAELHAFAVRQVSELSSHANGRSFDFENVWSWPTVAGQPL